MDTVRPYDTHAQRFASSYESLRSEAVHESVGEFVTGGADRTALDIGAGSGRDAAWLASKGYQVVAVEPSAAMRREAAARHPSEQIHWLDDRLPSLARVHERGIAYDLILISAVWMHVTPKDRERAFRKIVTLLKPGGVLLMSLRDGPSEADRPMWPAPLGEIESLARSHGLAVLKSGTSADQIGRPDVNWTTVALRLPDDGSGALPVLRGIILKDDKSSTYKLGLLRSIARIADAMPSLARPLPDRDDVSIPLGAVAMVWVRMYLPLVAKRLPQAPRNQGPDGLGFAKEGFRALLNRQFLGQDLKVGAQFSTDTGREVLRALSEASDLITRLVSEWTRLVRGYAGPQSALESGQITDALTWIEPERDTRFARTVVDRMQQAGKPVECVWTGSALRSSSVDIDHCLPWSAWPCNDLWNLMPSTQALNRNQKRERLPSVARLASARERIQQWWSSAWLEDPILRLRFQREAEAALPIQSAESADDVFEGLEWRRLRLRTEQQVSEWT